MFCIVNINKTASGRWYLAAFYFFFLKVNSKIPYCIDQIFIRSLLCAAIFLLVCLLSFDKMVIQAYILCFLLLLFPFLSKHGFKWNRTSWNWGFKTNWSWCWCLITDALTNLGFCLMIRFKRTFILYLNSLALSSGLWHAFYMRCAAWIMHSLAPISCLLF